MVVMDALAPFTDSVDFLYTDISPALVGYGRRTYGGAYPFARFQLLDVEQDVQGEGIGSYDIVFGTNVLHATRNMGNTLQNCKALLRCGGLMIANELTTKTDFLTLTFGLTDGWWMYDDQEWRMPGMLSCTSTCSTHVLTLASMLRVSPLLLVAGSCGCILMPISCKLPTE